VSERHGNPVPQRAVQSMFDRIAPVYDAMNTLMTAGLDARWRAEAIGAAGLAPGMRVLDVACGTGKLARAAAAEVGEAGEVIGLDRSAGMLQRAARVRMHGRAAPLSYVAGDALALPFPPGSAGSGFDAVSIGFGLRNLPDYVAGLAEMHRVLAPGGRLVVLELSAPAGGPALLLYRTWFQRIVPLLGRMLRSGAAYRYLPDSLRHYPDPDGVAEFMRGAGFEQVTWRRLVTGMATVHVGTRAVAR